MKRPIFLIPVFLTLVAIAGCATPESRIKDDPATYSQLTPEQQALVKSGKIGLGMPLAAVQLALGKPDRVTEHTDAAGVQQIWHYVEVDTSYVPAPYPYGWYGYPRVYDPFFFPGAGLYGAYPVQTASDKMRVVFKDGKVAAIEREM